jgi:cytochrome c-type biogenesis protein CcmE
MTGKWKWIFGGAIILGAVVFLIVTATQANAQYFMTVEELLAQRDSLQGKTLRISGVVLGDTIQVNSDEIRFTVAHVPGDMDEVDQLGGMAVVLRSAAQDSSLPRLQVVYHGVRPDLLKDASQAIMTGKLGADGLFYADELLLKCPTKYEENPTPAG